MKKWLTLLIILPLICAVLLGQLTPALAQTGQDGDVSSQYTVYDENNEMLFEKSQVTVGDYYVSKEYKKYKVISVNESNKTGYAKFVTQLTKPKVTLSPTPNPISTESRQIGLYCSHNDESYEPTQGYYSIYGKGGIHQVAAALQTAFEQAGVTTTFDETLHLPHDSGAYTRSNVTARRLLSEHDLDALFDIHRDGASRSTYATVVDGAERCKIRIVVGQANANMEKNEALALYISSVADELYPWLINDIYYATGHYNQALFEKALLFEMGTYSIEEELVLESVDPFVEVLNTVLFNTTVNPETGELEIGGTPTTTTPLVGDALEDDSISWGSQITGISIFIYVTLLVFAIIFTLAIGLMIYRFVAKKWIKK